MTQSTATPGPWAVYDKDPLVIVDANGSSLGEMVPGDPFISPQEARANAALAAASWSMREALRKAVQLAEIAIDWNLDEVEIDGQMVNTRDLRGEFEAALRLAAPAEGDATNG